MFTNPLPTQLLPGATDVVPIDVHRDTQELITVDIDGNELGREKIIHPVISQITGNQCSFIKVRLPHDTNEETFRKTIVYNDKYYRIDLVGGSALKSAPGVAGTVYGIQVDGVHLLADMLGFEESSYYGQRALFPLVVGGVKGKIRVRTLPVNDDSKKTFRLKNNTAVQIEDGWGYIIKSLADEMAAKGLSREKRSFGSGSGRASYQMLQWLDTDDPEIVEELVTNGLQAFRKFMTDNPDLFQRGITQDNDKIKTLHSILTTGRPPMELAVAMPVAGDSLVIPQYGRFTGKAPGRGVCIIRSPADKQNFYPVPAGRIDRNSAQSRLVTEMEGMQYTLTGREDGQLLTFFKGMLGIIPDHEWPEAWAGADLIVTSKDRKLYESWIMDSSLQAAEALPTVQNDRATTHRASQDISIDGSLVATQWFEKGSFIGVPNAIQKWLGGDYDGDEVGVIFNSINPALSRRIRQVYSPEEINAKLTKTFTYNPQGRRAKRFMDMRSPNAGLWSSLAAWIKTLPDAAFKALARQTAHGRLLTSDGSLNGLSEPELMIKEVQLGIKVGTDAYKTAVSTAAFEERARTYRALLNQLSRPILHDSKTMHAILSQVGIFPTLAEPAWRNIFFSYDRVNTDDGVYQTSGLSPRILQRMIRKLLPYEDLARINGYYRLWLDSDGFDPTGKLVPNVHYLFKQTGLHTRDHPDTIAYLAANAAKGGVSCYEAFEINYFKAAVKHWRSYNEWALRMFDLDTDWKAGLRNLLKRYYMLSA